MKAEPTTEIERALDELIQKDESTPNLTAAESHAPNSAVSLKRILVPTDFSDCAKEALDLAVPLGRQFGATLIILYVLPSYCEGDLNPPVLNSTQQLLDQLVCESVPLDIFSKTVIRAGPASDEIVRVAEEFKTDLIVISTHGYTGLKHAWFGSTAENVVRTAPCPVTHAARQKTSTSQGITMSAKAYSLEFPERPPAHRVKMTFGQPRDFLDNRFVYVVISPRARGLSVGINMNPDQFCNFDCAYCEVNRDLPPRERELDVFVMGEELQKTLLLVRSGRIRELGPYQTVNGDLLELRHVALSGDGEPTLCPNFGEAVQKVVQVRARYPHSFFKLALITNGTRLDLPDVQDTLNRFTRDDEIWIKLDAGSQAYMDKVNRSEVPLEKVIQNILLTGRKRPVIIQSLFPFISGQEPQPEEIDHYIHRLNDLKNGGAEISLIQIYSATRPTPHSECGHMPLKSLARISRRIKAETGLKAEVF